MKRCLGVLIVLLFFLLIWLPHLLWWFWGYRMFWWRIDSRITETFYNIVLLMAALGFFLNIFLSIIRPWLYKLKHGSMESYRFISGIPLLISLAAVYSSVFLTPRIWPSILASFIVMLDFGGPVWFVIFTWKDESLWGSHQRSRKD